jgi:hypothetical protein
MNRRTALDLAPVGIPASRSPQVFYFTPSIVTIARAVFLRAASAEAVCIRGRLPAPPVRKIPPATLAARGLRVLRFGLRGNRDTAEPGAGVKRGSYAGNHHLHRHQ